MRVPLSVYCCVLLSTSSLAADDAKPAFKAGVAVKVITPTEPHWMSGYGGATSRPRRSSTTLVKALALEDPAGTKLVVLTSDLVASIARCPKRGQEVKQRAGLPRERSCHLLAPPTAPRPR